MRRGIRWFWHIAVLGAVLAAAWYFIDFDEFTSALASAQWSWLVLLMGLSTIDRFLMAGKWWQLLHYVKSQATFGSTLSAYYQVAFLQRFIPSSLSGDALRALLISRRFQGTSGVLATMVVEKLVAMVAAIILALVCLGLLVPGRQAGQLLWIFVMVPTLLAAVLVGLRLSLHRPWVDWLIARLPTRFRPSLARVYEQYASFRDAPRLLGWHFFYAMLEQIVQVLMWLVAAVAIGVETPLLTLFAALSVAQCVRKFAIIVEGWLFGEFTMILILSLVGVPQAQALAFSLLAHATAVVASAPGAFLFARSAVSLAELRPTRQPA